jgi:hypothetical protein
MEVRDWDYVSCLVLSLIWCAVRRCVCWLDYGDLLCTCMQNAPRLFLANQDPTFASLLGNNVSPLAPLLSPPSNP